jgi:hypothetical protein
LIKIHEEASEEGSLAAYMLRMDNAVLILFDRKGSSRLGTLAVGIPGLYGVHQASSVLLGDKNAVLAKMLAERLSGATGKIALVSLHAEALSEEGGPAQIVKLMESVIKKVA